ncbi:MAG TPA: TerB family tellurite resistance protein [Pseudomonadales bacterium]|nr:TerB family tellurite resistance protein [Pseudomonadales bacterium]
MWLHTLSRAQRETLINLAHNVVVSDGLLDPNEELMLDSFKREMELSPDVEIDYIALDGIADVFDSRRVRRIALLNLIHLSYVDGALEIEEECLLQEVAQAFGVDETEFALLENWVKRLLSLEQEAVGLL